MSQYIITTDQGKFRVTTDDGSVTTQQPQKPQKRFSILNQGLENLSKTIQKPEQVLNKFIPFAQMVSGKQSVSPRNITGEAMKAASFLPGVGPFIGGASYMAGSQFENPKTSVGGLLTSSTAGGIGGKVLEKTLPLAGKAIKGTGNLIGKIPINKTENLGDFVLQKTDQYKKALDDKILSLYRYAYGGKLKNITKIASSDENRLTAVKAIHENIPNLKLPDPETGLIEARPPTNRLEDFEAFRQTKQAIWNKVTALSKGATEKGAQVNLGNVADEAMKDVEKDIGEPLSTFKPTTVKTMNDIVTAAKEKGNITPTSAQNYLKFLNAQIQDKSQPVDWAVTDLYRNIRAKLADATDKSIMNTLQKAGYSDLRKQYGALLDGEKERLAAANKFISSESGKGFGISHPMLDVWSVEDVLQGIVRGDSSRFLTAAGKQVAKKVLDYMKSPDRRIVEMYQVASKVPKTFKPIKSQLALPSPTKVGGGIQLPYRDIKPTLQQHPFKSLKNQLEEQQ